MIARLTLLFVLMASTAWANCLDVPLTKKTPSITDVEYSPVLPPPLANKNWIGHSVKGDPIKAKMVVCFDGSAVVPGAMTYGEAATLIKLRDATANTKVMEKLSTK